MFSIKKVLANVAQSLTDAEKLQARTNIGAGEGVGKCRVTDYETGLRTFDSASATGGYFQISNNGLTLTFPRTGDYIVRTYCALLDKNNPHPTVQSGNVYFWCGGKATSGSINILDSGSDIADGYKICGYGYSYDQGTWLNKLPNYTSFRIRVINPNSVLHLKWYLEIEYNLDRNLDLSNEPISGFPVMTDPLYVLMHFVNSDSAAQSGFVMAEATLIAG